MLDAQVIFDVAYPGDVTPALQQDLDRAATLERPVRARPLHGSIDQKLDQAEPGELYDLLIVPLPDPTEGGDGEWKQQVERLQMRARCPIFHVRMPDIPRDASRD